MAHDVFISYASDDKAMADAVCHALEDRDIRCWIAPRDILPGAEWATEISRAIAACRAMVLIFSSHANTSVAVHKEVHLAFENILKNSKKKLPGVIIPFRREEVEPALELQLQLSGVHWLDARAPPLEERLNELAFFVDQILTAISPEYKERRAARAKPAPPPPPEPAPPQPQPATPDRAPDGPAPDGAKAGPQPPPPAPPPSPLPQPPPRANELAAQAGQIVNYFGDVQRREARRQVIQAACFWAAILVAGVVAWRMGWFSLLQQRVQDWWFPKPPVAQDGALDKGDGTGPSSPGSWELTHSDSSPLGLSGRLSSLDTRTPVTCVAVSPSDMYALVGKGGMFMLNRDRAPLAAWKLPVHEKLSFSGPFVPDKQSLTVSAVAFSPHSDLALSAETQEPVFSARELVFGGATSKQAEQPAPAYRLRLWNVGAWQQEPRFAGTGHTQLITCVAFSADGRSAYSGSKDGTVWVWDVDAGQGHLLCQSPAAVTSLAVATKDAARLLTGHGDGVLRVLDTRTGLVLQELRGHTGAVTSVAWSADGGVALSGGEDKTLRVWDVANGKGRLLGEHEARVNSVALTRDGRRALSGEGEYRFPKDDKAQQVKVEPVGCLVRLWDVERNQEVDHFTHKGVVNSVAFSGDGANALSGDSAGSVWWWVLPKGAAP